MRPGRSARSTEVLRESVDLFCVKHVALMSVFAGVIFAICFVLVWGVAKVIAQVVPAADSLLATASLAISLAMTGYVIFVFRPTKRR